MQSVLNAFWVFAISVVLDNRCSAHKCFQCRSDENEHCADLKYPETYRKSCSDSSYGYCRKSTFILYFADQDQSVTIRECVNRRFDTLTMKEGCYSGKYTEDSYSLTCECRGESCNGNHVSNQRNVFSLNNYVLIELIIQLLLR